MYINDILGMNNKRYVKLGNYSAHGFISIQYIYTTIESMVAASIIRVSQNLHAPVAHINPTTKLTTNS